MKLMILAAALLLPQTALAWDAYDSGGATSSAAEEEEAPGLGYSLRAGPSLLRYPEGQFDTDTLEYSTVGASSFGLLVEGELLRTFSGGFASGFSLGLAHHFSVEQTFIPVKVHIGLAGAHGGRFTVHGVIMPAFAGDGGSTGFNAGFGAHAAYDFLLGDGEEAWGRDEARSWGLGGFADVNVVTPLTDSGFGFKGHWVGAFTLGAVLHYQ